MAVAKEAATLRIDKGYEIPSVPLVLTRIIQILADNQSTARQLEDLILHDPSLSARILRLANSAFYSFRYEVRTISHAITLLGMDVVKSLAIGVSIFESFTHGMRKEARLINGLWMHSFGTALLAQEIWSRWGERKESEFAFLCGLLHDLGKVVFFKTNPARYAQMFVQENGENGPEIAVREVEQFGIDHAAVGAILAKQWGLPPDLASVIGEHHAALASDIKMVAAVSLADILSKKHEIGYSGDHYIPSDSAKIRTRLNMEADAYERLESSAASKRCEADAFFHR